MFNDCKVRIKSKTITMEKEMKMKVSDNFEIVVISNTEHELCLSLSDQLLNQK